MILLRQSPTDRLKGTIPFVNFFPCGCGCEEESENDAELSWSPATDIYDDEENYVLKMEMPGLSKTDIKIQVENGTIAVSGERKQENEVKEENYRWTERRSGKFYRAFNLPKHVDAQKIGAAMKDGVLELRVPKPAEQKPRNIPVTVH